MKTSRQCVVCGVRLPSIKRSDTRYCGHTCRRRAWRTRRKGRSQDVLRARHTTLRPLLLACWPIGFRSRLYMRPFSPPELLQRIGELGAKLEAAQQRVSDLRAQIALLEARATLSDQEKTAGKAELTDLQTQLQEAQAEVERLTSELDAASSADADVEDSDENNDDDEDDQEDDDEGHKADDVSATEEWSDPDDSGEDADDDDATDNSAARLEVLQTQYADLSAENERLKEKLKSRQTDFDEDLDTALARAESAERELAQAKGHYTHQQELLVASLTAARRDARQAELLSNENLTIATALGVRLQREQQRGKVSPEPVTQAAARAEIESMRRQIGQLQAGSRSTQGVAGTTRDSSSHPAHAPKPGTTTSPHQSLSVRPAPPAGQLVGRSDSDDLQRVRKIIRERDEARQERDDAIGERDKARRERDAAVVQRDTMQRERNRARQVAIRAKAQQEEAETSLQKRASKIVSALETRKEVLAKGVEAYPFSGSYKPSADPLLMALVREIQDHENLARRQDIRSKPVTAPLLNPALTTAEQAFAVVMAERWRLYADPPKSLKERVRWQVNGLILNAESEELLRKRSDDRGYDSWFASIWYEPIKPRTKGRRSK